MNEVPPLPHNVEAEQQLLGCLLCDNSLLADELSGFDPAWFFEPVHDAIFRAARARVSSGRVASPVSLKDDLRDNEGLLELGGPTYLVRLAGVGFHGNLRDLAKIVRDNWAKRRALEGISESRNEIAALDGMEDPAKAISRLESVVGEILTEVSPKPLTQSFLASQIGAIQAVNQARKGGGVAGISTGYDQLDRKIGGMSPGDMIVIAGRTSMGKTAIALEIAWRVAIGGRGVLFASLEMSKEQLAPRFWSSRAAAMGEEIPYFDIRRGSLTDDQFRTVGQIAKQYDWLPMQVAESDCRSVDKLRSAAMRARAYFDKAETPLSLMVVDYVQLVQDDKAKSDYQRVSHASTAMKAMARDLGIPVIVLSQLNRSVEMRDPPIPKLSDLRESGRIEEDADLILLAYRPEYYLAKELEELDANDEQAAEIRHALSACQDHLTLFIPKARGGPTGAVSMRMRASLNRLWQEGEKFLGPEV